jgi:GxxExxY protein
MNKVNLVEEELSYKIRGILYKVHNELGCYRNEKQYCDAIENELKIAKLTYQREKILEPSFNGEKRGRNRIDFTIDNKIIVEVKVETCLSKDSYQQCLRYLTSTNIELALLVNFRPKSCVVKRVLNPKFKK